MKILTYLGFTMLSVFIQFSVMDFINGMLKLDDKPTDRQGTSQKRQLRDVLTNISYKPHAIYYRSQNNKGLKNHSPAKLFSNTTLHELFATTDNPTTVFEVLYDENVTATEDTYTTESLYTSTDIENITEITFFDKGNETTITTTVPKRTAIRDCSCNIMFRVCDIDCCCDEDCSASELELFPNCATNKSLTDQHKDGICVSQLQYFGYGHGLFCIVSINLPEEKKLDIQKTDFAPIEGFLRWKSKPKASVVYEFSNKLYKHGDPIWLLKNGSFYHTDLPAPKVNNYCTGRKPIQFLKDEIYSCNVKIPDLEMLQIIQSVDETNVISATSLSMNSTVLNCTGLHCINWTVIVCDKMNCYNYNKTIHEPQCTQNTCNNLALKLDYIFYYHDSKITNASIKFHIQNLTMDIPYMAQEVNIKFILANESIDSILQLSGNPGYLDGLPIIVSYAKNNYTDTFYNRTVYSKRHLLLPGNENGVCTSPNVSNNLMLFGRNRRIKCRYNHKYVKLGNTEECIEIQNSITKLLGLSINATLSPLGNPYQLKDKDWLSIENESVYLDMSYGRYQERTSKLLCYNLITRYSIIISYANINRNNRILSCKFRTAATNATFNIEDISLVVTIDINFMDVTKQSLTEYATGPPSLNIHLPKDFFYPFRSKESHIKCNILTMIYLITLIISCK